MAKRGPKRTKTQMEIDLAKIARLDRMGYDSTAISVQIGVTRQQVDYDLKKIRKQYAETKLHEREMYVNQINAQLNDLLVEHWRCYKLLHEEHVKITIEKTPRVIKDKDGNVIDESFNISKETTVTEQLVPGAEHLRAIHDILKSKRELFGTDAPKRVDVRKLTIDLETLMQQAEQTKEVQPVDVVDQQLEQLIKEIPSLPPIPKAQSNGNGDLPNGLHEL